MKSDTIPLLPSHPSTDDLSQLGCLRNGKGGGIKSSLRERKVHKKHVGDHAQRRRKLLGKFGLFTGSSPRDLSLTPDMSEAAEKHGILSEGERKYEILSENTIEYDILSENVRNHGTLSDDARKHSILSLTLPWMSARDVGKENFADFTTTTIPYEQQSLESWDTLPTLLPKQSQDRKRIRRVTEGYRYKTSSGDTKPLNPSDPTPRRPSRSHPSTPTWPSVIHGLHSVSLLLLVTLLSPVSAFCPRICKCDDMQLRSECVEADLDVVPILLNPGILELNLSHNRIKTILEGFTFYTALEYLDLSHNEVVSLGTQNFLGQRSLHTLVINNNKVSRILGRAFIGLLKLTSLDLSDNYIETIENNAFGPLGKLKSLDLSNNRIKNLTLNTFMKLRGLKVLNLRKNELKHISSAILDPLRELEELYLCSNQIAMIQDFAFKSLKALRKLGLSNNKVFRIHDKAFSGLDSLKVLVLKDNAFTDIPSHVLPSVKGLEELDLSINPLTTLPTGPFTHVSKLKTLYISRCENLTSINGGTFKSLDHLTSLVLSFNPQLTSLHQDVFKPLTSLRHLVLRGNSIRTFDYSLVSTTNLQSLDLRDNSLECNCSLKWLQEASRNNTISLKIEEISCTGPEGLKGKSLSQLSEYDLACYNYLVVLASAAAAAMAFILLMVTFGVLYYKNCRKMKAIVHDNWPEKIVATWKDPEYQKQVEDEEYTFHSLRGVQHIPVTVI